MRNVIVTMLGVLSLLPIGFAPDEDTVTDVYRFVMYVQTPRIYDNMQSQGYRKYKRDIIEGELWLTYPSDGSDGAEILVTNLVNKTYKVGGANVRYTAYLNDAFPMRVNVIGNNKTQVFRMPSVAFSMICDPSYNIGEIDEDNTLYITLGGHGTMGRRRNAQVIRTLGGYLSGTLGCGCSAYGHVSPTRINGVNGPMLDKVNDVGGVWGTWRAVYKRSFKSLVE